MSLGSNAIILKQVLGVSLPVAVRLLRRPEHLLTEKEIAVKRKVELVLGKRSSTVAVEGDKIKIPPPPPNPAAWDVKTVTKKVKASGFTLVNSIPDMRPGKESSVYVSAYANPILPVEHEIVGQVLQAGEFHKKFGRELAPLLILACDFIVSGGTQEGFFARVASGFAQEVKCELPQWVTDELMPAANAFLPWSANVHTDLSEAGRENLEYTPNLAASYGLPYPEYSKRDYIPVGGEEEKPAIILMYEEAQEILKELVKGSQSFNDWTQKPRGRAFFAVMLKNKVELIARKNMDVKVRPYACYSAPLAYLYSQLWAAYSSGIEMAGPENLSISLIGLSWVGGGATIICKIIQAVQPGGARYTAYADDFFVVVRCADGTIYLFFFDIQQMDTSISSQIGSVAATLLKERITSEGETPERLPNDFLHVLSAWKYSAFRPEVVFQKGVTGKPNTSHLFSGVPGTSRVDEVASFIICTENALEETFQNVTDFADLQTRIPTFVERTKKIGFIVKESTLVPQKFEYGKTVVGPILGQSLFFDDEQKEYYPGPQKPERCIASLIYPKRQIKKPNDRIAYAMIVAIGIAVSGAAAHEVVYESCKAIWDYGRGKDIVPDVEILGNEETVGFESVDYVDMVFDADGTTKEFPSRQTLKEMLFTTYRPEKIIHDSIPLDVLEDIEKRIEDIKTSTDWGDLEESSLLEKLAKGLISVEHAKAPKADVERMGVHLSTTEFTSPAGKRPEDADLKRAKDKAFQEKIEKQKAAKAEVKATSINMGTKVKGKDKKLQIYVAKNSSPRTAEKPQEHKHALTNIEEEELLEETARKASGDVNNRTKNMLLKRITLLEDKMNDVTSTLSEEERERIIEEIESIDKRLKRI